MMYRYIDDASVYFKLKFCEFYEGIAGTLTLYYVYITVVANRRIPAATVHALTIHDATIMQIAGICIILFVIQHFLAQVPNILNHTYTLYIYLHMCIYV